MSLLKALDDITLPHTIFNIFLDAYVPEKLGLDLQNDPFISPGFATDEFLIKLPGIRIFSGD